VGIFSVILPLPVAKNDTSCAISLKDLASETVVVELTIQPQIAQRKIDGEKI
jgi:hypothetical protein